ncbi:MAG: hypothetical protein LBC84_00120 [Prevotellaceae bacterium]|nr:hypothetical protein [Prevotellaceae bacterium]
MMFTFENNYLSSRCEALRFIFSLGNRQFTKGNKDKHIRSRLTLVLHNINRAWAVCLFVTGCLAIPQNFVNVRFHAFFIPEVPIAVKWRQ